LLHFGLFSAEIIDNKQLIRVGLKGANGQMRTGYDGHLAISWLQTELDGLEAAPLSDVSVGAAWSWRGRAMQLNEAESKSLEHLSHPEGFIADDGGIRVSQPDNWNRDQMTLVLTNGAQRFVAHLISGACDRDATLVFEDMLPPCDQEFWICEVSDVLYQYAHMGVHNRTVVSFPSRQDLVRA